MDNVLNKYEFFVMFVKACGNIIFSKNPKNNIFFSMSGHNPPRNT